MHGSIPARVLGGDVRKVRREQYGEDSGGGGEEGAQRGGGAERADETEALDDAHERAVEKEAVAEDVADVCPQIGLRADAQGLRGGSDVLQVAVGVVERVRVAGVQVAREGAV